MYLCLCQGTDQFKVKFRQQILFNIILIILLLFYYAKAFTSTRTVSLDMLLGNVVKGIAELFVFY